MARESGESGLPDAAMDPVAPIYRRLPSGPHRFGPREVAAHQRARIHGAMVEAVARHGYDQVTVREVIGLAGVSRRSFYEHFANRHDCFLHTVAEISVRQLATARDACEDAPPERRPATGLKRLAREACAAPEASRLVLLASLSAGDTGAAVLGEAMETAEQLLAGSLAPAPGTSLPAGVIRSLGGALAGTLVAALEAKRPAPTVTAAEMSRLAESARLDAAGASELGGLLAVRMRRAALTAATGTTTRAVGTRTEPTPASPSGSRERLLRSAMRAAARQPVDRLTPAQVADGAGLPVDSFFVEFADTEACLVAGVELCHERLLSTVGRARATGAGWAQETRLALAAVLAHLAADPAPARTVALVAHRAGEKARSRNQTLSLELGAALCAGAPAGAPAPAAVSGALWRVTRQLLLEGRARLLPAFSDHIGYVLLAPALGPQGALEALRGGAPAPGGPG